MSPEKPQRTATSNSSTEKVDQELIESSGNSASEVNLYSLHELHAGRLIIDPEEAKIELGDAIASRLKLTPDGTKVLWPQPTDSDKDPQNWSDRRKNFQLLIMTLASVVPDFDSGIGIAAIFALAEEYDTTTGVINNLTSNWSIFLLGPGGICAVMLIRRLGRLPVLFWTQVLALGFMVGCTFAPNLKTFAAMRCLTAFFGTAPQVTGLYVVTDLFPFHLQARKLNIWTMGFIVSPFLSPFAFGFLVARADWRWSYGIGTLYSVVVVLLIMFYMEETLYDRTVQPIPEPEDPSFRVRVRTLIGVTGWKMQKYRISWKESVLSPFKLIWRPHLLMLLIYEVTNAVFLGLPVEMGGYAFSQYAIAASYATPIVSVFLGEIVGRYANDFIMNVSVRRNKGVFEAESRLWACYIAMPLYVCGFLTLGAAFQKHLSIGALVMGWGIAELSIMIATVAIIAYCNDAFPKHQGEISALINLARVLGGFGVAYFQVPWALKHGAIQMFGCEAAIVVGLFFLVIPFMQIKGRYLREKYSAH
ncbi:hypothetical protein NLJ89_g1381 [Agrocybe chaxingu]|uniref:Major facilitator superfamily (MFS) profile domain-containing protein n=1 Tax=Agrocybe chaxingu TaxID=84603 RepID=A0A9W8N066_9AGAR|nr:hypothetical protein NLJ89_g1381 [Agrocybe chaxingu]